MARAAGVQAFREHLTLPGGAGVPPPGSVSSRDMTGAGCSAG
ncbi:MAG: hypothetical protein ACI9ZH_002474, partial [Paracoccaceae bacterium]